MRIKYILTLTALIFSIYTFGQSKKSKINYDESLYNSIEYRLIGPFRGGRAGTAVGVLNNPNLYYRVLLVEGSGKHKMLALLGNL